MEILEKTNLSTDEKPKSKKRICREDRREQILSVAAQLFSQKGFNGTTTKELAEQIGVSEAILFRHFSTKQELYSAILDDKTNELMQPLWLNCEELMLQRNDYEVFVTLAAKILETLHQDPCLLRLLFYSALEGHQLASNFLETTVRQVREPAVNYIKQRIEENAFRPIDPILAARSFFSLVMHRGLGRELFQDSDLQKTSSWEAAQEITDIFLFGILKSKDLSPSKE